MFLSLAYLPVNAELRAFLQTLLDLLQRAEDYIRDKVDLTFFTQTLPQLVENIYSSAFPHGRERRDLNHGLTQINRGTTMPDYLNIYNVSKVHLLRLIQHR